MQILCIRGANLASLADNFEIDMTQEPLRSAGLFAITGETGSGKSTILDALCLALYGSCPRLSGAGVNDDVPDVTGETIKSSDPRAILRRGAHHGYAEVDFLAPDGFTYRANWTARRARGRADGKLQSVERALTRLDDNQLLESQITRVKDKVTEITGLTYEECRRTVLLAQGDFDAFLSANTADRAALLEKVTGTELYREISKRVYLMHEEAKQKLVELEGRRGATPVLTDEERDAMAVQADMLGKEIAELTSALNAIKAKISSHEALNVANTRVVVAQAKLKDAEAAVEARKPLRENLGRMEAALTLKSEYERSVAANKAMTNLQISKQEAERSCNDLQGKLDAALEAQMTAQKSYDTAEKSFKDFGPIWTQAAHLDSLSQNALGEVTTARSRHEESGTKVTEAKAALDTLRAGLTAAQTGIEETRVAMAKAPDTHLLADRWSSIDSQIAERIILRSKVGTTQAGITSDQKNLVAAKDRLTKLNQSNETDQKTHTELEQAIGELSEKLKELAEQDPQLRLRKLGEGVQAVKDMLRSARTQATSQSTHDTAKAEHSKQLAIHETAKAELESSESEINRATAAAEALAAPVGRAEAAVSDLAKQLRQHLEPGSDCPVCGSKEHPTHEDGALAEIARDMRARLEAERKALDAARRAGTTAARLMQAADLAANHADKSMMTALNDMEAAVSEYAEARDTALNTGMTNLPEAPTGAAPQLVGLQERLGARRVEIEAAIQLLSDLSKSAEQKRERIAKLGKIIEGRREARDTEISGISKIEAALSLASQQVTQCEERIAAIDTDIAPALAAVSVTPTALDTDGPAKREKMAKIVTWWGTQKDRLEKHQEMLKLNEPKITAAEAELRGLQANLETARTALDVRSSALKDIKDKRDALLGGEQTDSHRTRHNNLRIAAARKREEATQQVADARSSKTGADERLNLISTNLAPALEEAESAEKLLAGKMAPHGFDVKELAELIAQGPEGAAALKEQLKAVDDALGEAKSTLQNRTGDYTELMEKGAPEEPEADLRTALAGSELQRDDKRESIGAITGRLQADDVVRESLKSLRAEINAAAAICKTWAAVNEAVGSRQGGKFAQIAQSVTLSILVERANEHLCDLKPRYQLMTGGEDLALHIVDQDMGDEVRSTRSLSGGERFLVSLALALALSSMGGHGGLATTLFIDEGFGSLDAESLDIAMDALETLQAQGRTIGVISHVEAMKDRIPVQVRVTRRGAGSSTVALTAAA
ncbi:hypothetical protein LCGC14_0270560 [marine sediment metagenome]|uniref:Rad50/SbcC-type AAA domain-containing protein n=1 Tax=marine sediment metagenome TaxID=412755 RepID=A0A0F9UFN7_9ZZZZ